jgi:nucleoside-diphosphate-sugar epimerase
MARVLVTGGTGFIGRHLVRRLVECGDDVRCLVRSPDRQTVLGPLKVEYVLGDVTVPETLGPALCGVETVYHLAGATLPPRPEMYTRINAEGTRHLAEACARRPEPPVLVYVSSLAAAGPTRSGPAPTETSPCRPVSAYGRSKLAAERNLRALADRLPITVLRPPGVFGPGDPYTVTLFRMARWGLALVPGLRVFRLSWLYVEDLAEALVLAAQRGRRLAPAPDVSGEGIYFVALDEQPTVHEVARLAAEVQGRRPPWIVHLPALLCRAPACFNDVRTRLSGRAYWLNSDKLREALGGSWVCNADKARRELGFACRTGLAEGFRRAVGWYQLQGWL